jgi:hypothetical protein
VGILLPLAAAVCYITSITKYSSNNVLQQTLHTYFHLTEQKVSLSPSCVPAAAGGSAAGTGQGPPP